MKGMPGMYEIVFYKYKNGREPVLEYILELAAKTDKDSRIKHNKTQDYIQALSDYGTQVGEPYMKHLEGEIWELKTPRREIEQAKRNLADYREES
ncbi:hypothetical protein FACS1894187_19520 [Synergistales bacterium]|nr:hypothetical protein FACS1894187_19520 [Synergistales bacterium]